MAQGIFLHEYNTGGKLYDGDVTVANNKIANKQYVIDNAALQSNNLSDLDDAGTARTNLGVAIGSNVQAYSARLGELSALSQADGSFVVSDGTSFIFEGAATARASMGVDAAGTDNSTDVTLASVSGNYLSISGQEVTASTVPVSLGGTGATSASAARTALSVDVAGTDNSTDVTLAGKDFASISGQAITFAQIDLTDDVTGTLPIANGGIGATSAPMVGVITAANAGAVRTLLDLVPGTDIQAYDAELAALAGLTSAANKVPMFSGSGAATVIDFLDEDGLSSNSATAVPSQQSVKAFVEAQVQGLDIKESARLASTANVAGSYSSGVLTVTSAGVLTIDGGNVAINNRVLLKDQTTGTQNGIYKCTTAGEAASGTSPNTSSPSTLDDAQYGSSSTLSSIQMTSATLSSSSTFIEYASYTGSSFTPPANGVMILSDGSDTIAFNLSGYPSSLNSSGSWPIESSPNNYNATYSSVTSLSVDSSTTVAFRSRTVAPLFSLGNGTAMTSSSSSFALSSGWGGSTISAGHYIEYQNYASNKWYWRIEADIENGDTSISVAFDSDDSYSSSPTGAYFSGSSTLALFAGQSGGSAVAAVLTRADDFNSDADITAGAFCFVEEGTASADAGFVLSTNEPITLDTTALAFSQFSGAGSITAGTGLTKSGNTIAATGGLADIAGLAKTDGGIIVGDGSNFVLESGATARTSLGAQTLHANLTDLSGLAVTDGGIIVGDGSNFVLESGATARTSLGVSIGSDVQAYDAQLDTLSGFTAAQVTRGIADDNLLTVDDADAADNDYAKFTANGIEGRSFSEVKTDLGLVIGTDVQAYDAQLDTLSGFSAAQVTRGIADDNLITADCASHAIANGDFAKFTANGVEGREPSQVRSDLSLVPGTDVQAYDAELAAIAGLTSAADKGVMFSGSESATTFDLTAAGRALLDDADAAAMRTTLGLVIGTDVAAADSSELSVNTAEPGSIAIANVNGIFVYDISSSSTAATVTLPSTATAGCLGKSVIFKIKSTVGSGSSFTITPAAQQTIDGEASIVLNQERQSVRLVVSEEYSSGTSVQCWVVV